MYVIRHENMVFPLIVTPMSWVALSALEVLIPQFASKPYPKDAIPKLAEKMIMTGEHIEGLWIEQDANAWDRMRYFEKD